MSRKIFNLLALAAIAIILGGCPNSETPTTEGTLGKIKSRDQIIIGVKTDYLPFGFIDQNGKNAGLEIDIARYISKELLDSADKVQFVPVVASNRIEFLQQGKIDLLIATMNDTEKRRQVIDFSENYYASGTGLLARKDSGISNWDDLKGKKVCGIQGSFYNKELTEMGIEMVNFSGTAEAYTALKDGRCLGFAYDDSGLVGKLLEPEWSKDYHQAVPVILVEPWGMGIRKGDTQFLEAVNNSILKMEAEGFIVAGEKKWKIPATKYAQERMERAKGLTENK
jgi:polar amino acid transport system substrate-binding protein